MIVRPPFLTLMSVVLTALPATSLAQAPGRAPTDLYYPTDEPGAVLDHAGRARWDDSPWSFRHDGSE